MGSVEDFLEHLEKAKGGSELVSATKATTWIEFAAGSKPFELFCQILPEERLIERIQQVGANSCNLLSPSFIVVCCVFATFFSDLRDISVTATIHP
jgi:hypothetical protein